MLSQYNIHVCIPFLFIQRVQRWAGYVAAVQNDYVSIAVTAIYRTSHSHNTAIFQHLEGRTLKNYAFILSTIDTGMGTFNWWRQHWFRCTLQLLLHRRCYCKHNYTLAKVFSLLLLLEET